MSCFAGCADFINVGLSGNEVGKSRARRSRGVEAREIKVVDVEDEATDIVTKTTSMIWDTQDAPAKEPSKQRSNSDIMRGATSRRPSVDVMALHQLTSSASKEKGEQVTLQNIRQGMYVTRRPDWKLGDEDASDQQPGMIVNVDETTETATVFWSDGAVLTHYRVDNGKYDLCEIVPRDCMTFAPPPMRSRRSRRDSQGMFADQQQTAIVLDWDDTLFPTSFVRNKLRLRASCPIDEQPVSDEVKKYARSALKVTASHIQTFLNEASKYGKLILVTLAQRPWVKDSCDYFYPGVLDLLEMLDVKIVYAQEILHRDVSELTKDMNEEECAQFFANVKGKAISSALESFYSSYEGQTWKNVISVGDSDFERLGTQEAARRYIQKIGGDSSPGGIGGRQEVDGHVIQVRTKTLKMLDSPSLEELVVELKMLQKWLPHLVVLDDSFDADLNDMHDAESIASIEERLGCSCPNTPDRSRSGSRESDGLLD